MRTRSSVAIAAAAVGIALAAVTPSRASHPSPLPPDGVVHTRAAEVARIRAHFDSVLSELPARDVASLSRTQRVNRSALLVTLRAYRDAGEFPHNYDFPGEAVPYFVDRGTGVLCAVAHLMASTGRRDIVDRVARMNNNVWVPELAGDTAFTRWLDVHGLTIDEAARIQVPYVVDDSPAPSASRARSSNAASSIALGGALAASVWTARANADGGSRLGNVLGTMAGATALGMGASTLGREGASPTLSAATMLAGATSAWLSTRSIMRQERIQTARRNAERATVAPLLPVDGTSGAGLSVTLRC